MESLEAQLGQTLPADRSPTGLMEAHQDLTQDIQRLQEEIEGLQTSFSEDLSEEVAAAAVGAGPGAGGGERFSERSELQHEDHSLQ
ncbi:hypothetical protein CRUP_026767, partial [Coryphaenoides rupestris]